MKKKDSRVKEAGPRISHAKLLQLIGEIDGVELRGVDKYNMAVILYIGGVPVELLRDGGEHCSHCVTRIGIAEHLS
jgi:hypothetical protein